MDMGKSMNIGGFDATKTGQVADDPMVVSHMASDIF